MSTTTNRPNIIKQIADYLSSLSDREIVLIAIMCFSAQIMTALLLFVLCYFSAFFNAEMIRYIPNWANDIMAVLYNGVNWWVTTIFDIVKAIATFFFG